MKNVLTLLLSVTLLGLSGGTAWLVISLSNNVEVSRIEAGNGSELVIPPTPAAPASPHAR